MIGEMVIKTLGSRGDDDSVSGIYVTDGTAMVDPDSQVSVSTGTADTPTTVLTTNKSKSIFRSNSSLSNDDSMSIYTTYSASMTKEERFRASVLAEERRIRKEYSMESGSGSFESLPESSFLPTTLITAKTPSPNRKQAINKKQRWSPFVGSVGTNDFDLDSIESDGIMRGEEERGLGKFQVLGIKARMAGSPIKKKNQKAKWSPFVGSVGTNDFDLDSIASDGSMEGGGRFQVLGIKSQKKTRSPGTLGGAAVLSSTYSSSDDASPDLVQAEDGYAGRSRGVTEASSKAKKKAAAAATSQTRPRVCGYHLKSIICILAGLVAIAIAVAVGAFIASNHTSDSIEGDVASQTEFQAPTQSNIEPPPLALSAPTAAPSLSTPAPSPLLATPILTPTSSPTKLKSTEGPTNSPAVAVTVTASPTGLRATPGPTNSPVFEIVIQRPTAAPVAVTRTRAPVSRPASAQPTPACLREDELGKPFFVNFGLGLQNCSWLAENPVFQILMCVDGLAAYDICRATCNSC
jgi:hypothetical protein